MKEFGFKKKERLSLKSSIDTLFNDSKNFSFKSLRILFNIINKENDFLVKTLFTVSKKKYKSAVDRNRIKRILREAYRLNKNILYSEAKILPSCQLEIAFIYCGDDKDITFKEIEPIMIGALNKISSIIVKRMSEY